MTKQANYIELKGRQYHIGCKRGDLASKIILVGDPERAKKIASHFESIQGEFIHREYQSFTGIYQGAPLSVMSTGIGEGNMEIAIIEISQIVENPILIRCGSCSSLSDTIPLGSLVISNQAHDLGNVCSYYEIQTDALFASPSCVLALEKACLDLKIPSFTGKTASAPGFYGPQGRQIQGFPIKRPNLIQELQALGIVNLEMEIATQFGMCQLKKIQAGAICAVFGNRALNSFLSEAEMVEAEQKCIQASLLAIHQNLV